MRERGLKMTVPGSFELPDLHDAVACMLLGEVEERAVHDADVYTGAMRLDRLDAPCVAVGASGGRSRCRIYRKASSSTARKPEPVLVLIRGVPVEEVARVKTRWLRSPLAGRQSRDALKPMTTHTGWFS